MKILITGGYGFIGSHMADRFYREGHKIYIIDNLSTGRLENVKVKHKFYNLDVSDKKCEDVFKADRYDIVIHLSAQVDVNTSIEHPYLDTKSNLLGLINMLDLSVKYGVKKFIFASSAAVYGNTNIIPVTEQTEKNPISPYGISKYVGETYCEKWRDIYGLNTLCFRFSNVYGPRQGVKGEAGVISIFLNKIINDQSIKVFGDGEQTRDFVYVEDLVDAVYKGAMCESCSGIYNLSTNTENSINKLINILSQHHSLKETIYKKSKKGDIKNSRLDNSRITEMLNWVPKYSFESGISKTYDWYVKYHNKKSESKYNKDEKYKAIKKENLSKTLPYIENFIIFLILFFINYKYFNVTGDLNTKYDYNFIYIIIMSVLYGQKQSILSVIFSSFIYIFNFVTANGDIVEFLYGGPYMIHIALYILIGVMVGYIIDKKNRELYFSKLKIFGLKEEYDFLEDMYNETRLIKEEMQKQIISSEDSFAKMYNIINDLQSLEIEKIFNSSIEVIEKIMKTNSVVVYSMNKDYTYLRVKAHSKNIKHNINSSLKIIETSYIQKIINNKGIFVNRKLNNEPIMAAPIIYNDKIIAIVCIYYSKFENLTLYYENLFRTVINLITDALIKAYLYDEGVKDKKYISGSEILTCEDFKKLKEKFEERKKEYGIDFTIIKVLNVTVKQEINNYLISTCIRDSDYIGLCDDNLYIILANVHYKECNNLIDRLSAKGIKTIIVSGEE